MNSYTYQVPSIRPHYSLNVYTHTPLYHSDVAHWLELGMGKEYNQRFNKNEYNKKKPVSSFVRVHYDDIENHSQR